MCQVSSGVPERGLESIGPQALPLVSVCSLSLCFPGDERSVCCFPNPSLTQCGAETSPNSVLWVVVHFEQPNMFLLHNINSVFS